MILKWSLTTLPLVALHSDYTMYAVLVSR